MAISRVGDQEAMPPTAEGAVTVNAVSGTTANDVLVHVFSMLNSTASVTEPTGLTALGSASSGSTLSARVRSKIAGGSTGGMLIGVDASLGANWTAAVSDYPNVRYTRDFGKDNTYTSDTDTLTEPTPYGQGKFQDLPAGAVMHLSWKDDPVLLTNWLDSLPELPTGHPGFYLSPWHEPRDEVDAGQFTTATFRAWGQQMSDIRATHPKGYLIRGVGPILTRFDLDERNANPADYGWDGMDFYGIDAYWSKTTGGYPSTYDMFQKVFDRVHAVYPGIPFLIPEYGVYKQDSDATGSGRASTLTTHVNWLKARGDVLGIAYFLEPGVLPGVVFANNSPEADAWRALQAAQSSGGGAEPATYLWQTNASPKCGAWVGAYRGVDTVDPIADVQVVAGVAGTSQTTPAVSVPANGWLVYGVATRHTPGGVGVNAWSSSGTATELADLATNAGTADLTMAVYEAGPLSAGSVTRTLTSTIAVGNSVVFAVALRPAVAGGGGTSDTQPILGLPVF